MKDLIQKLLIMDPTKRISVTDALTHPWVTGESASDRPLPKAVLESLSAFRDRCRLKKAVGRLLSDRMTDDDKAHLQELFKQYDKNGDGRLGRDEIVDLLRKMGGSDQDADEFLAENDQDGSGTITFDELQAAHAAGLLGKQTDKQLRDDFKFFDRDGDGFVTRAEIEALLSETPDAAKAMIAEVDKDNDGKISVEEWVHAMRGQRAKAAASSAPK